MMVWRSSSFQLKIRLFHIGFHKQAASDSKSIFNKSEIDH